MLRLWLNKILIHSYYHFCWVRRSPSIRGTNYRLFELSALDCRILTFIWTASALLQTPLCNGLSAHFIYNFILKSDSSRHATRSSTTINLTIMRDAAWRCSKVYTWCHWFDSNRSRLLMQRSIWSTFLQVFKFLLQQLVFLLEFLKKTILIIVFICFLERDFSYNQLTLCHSVVIHRIMRTENISIQQLVSSSYWPTFWRPILFGFRSNFLAIVVGILAVFIISKGKWTLAVIFHYSLLLWIRLMLLIYSTWSIFLNHISESL